MASRAEELFINKYFFGNQFGTLDEDRFKDETADLTSVAGNAKIDDGDSNERNDEEEEENIFTEIWESNYSIRYTSNCDSNDDVECAEFIKKTCGCKQQCTTKFSKELILQSRRNFRAFDYYEFGRNQLDVILLGIIHALVKSDQVSHARTSGQERKRLKFSFLFRGRRVCGDFFQFVHAVKRKRLKNLVAHYKRNDCNVLERVHKNYLNVPGSTLTNEAQQKCVKFLRNYAEDCASYLLKPVSSTSPAVILLPGDESKQQIHTKYAAAAQMLGMKVVSKKMFYRLWSEHCPDLVVHQKEKGEMADGEMVVSMEQGQQNLELMGCDTDQYNFISIPSFSDPVHISFDFAQQIHIPSNPQDPGPMYFLDLYKVNILGIANDTCNRHCRYVIPEAVILPKSQAVNAVVCYLHHYFQEFAAGEAELDLHAHNSTPQSKNNCLVQYLAWRIGQGLNSKITLTFGSPNLAKLDANYKFGSFKRQFRRSVTSCLNDVVNALNAPSADSAANFSFLVGGESGQLYMDIYDWQAAFAKAKFARVPFITSQSHFFFDDRWLGKVKCRKVGDEAIQTYTIFESSLNVASMSFDKIQPLGLSHERKLYLYEQVRPYCIEATRDILCPRPSVCVKNTKRQRVE